MPVIIQSVKASSRKPRGKQANDSYTVSLNILNSDVEVGQKARLSIRGIILTETRKLISSFQSGRRLQTIAAFRSMRNERFFNIKSRLPVNLFKVIDEFRRNQTKCHSVAFMTPPPTSFVCFLAVCSLRSPFSIPEARNYSDQHSQGASDLACFAS